MPNLSLLVAQYKGRSRAVLQESCGEMSARVVARTPVDTGALRKSWTPAINETDNSNRGGSIAAVVNQLKPGDIYTLTNGQDYARRIEYGYSAQAPQGMLRVSVAEWNSIVDESVRRNSGA